MSNLRLTLIQSKLHWEDRDKNLQQFEECINSIEGHKEIVVLPETFTTGFSMKPTALAESMEGESVNWMKAIARKHGIILTGSLMIREDEKYFNRLVWMQPDGNFGTYDKRHLFSYGGEDIDFDRGSKRFIAGVKGWKICTMICYDLRFPVWSRMHTEDEYDVLLYIANWPSKRVHAWTSLLRARAIENQCYVVGLNRTGQDGNGLDYPGESRVIDPLGQVLYEGGQEENIFSITLEKEHLLNIRRTFPFQHDKDEFILL